MIEMLKIPDKRKGVLIGKDGRVKKEIESKTGTELNIEEGVEIEGEPLKVMKAKDIIKAVGRGFSPETAIKLLDENFRLLVISLGQETDKTMKRVFSRIIGRKGGCKKRIEMLTNTDICIYGKTVSVIGPWEGVERAAEALELLIQGKPHSYVYRVMEEKE